MTSGEGLAARIRDYARERLRKRLFDDGTPAVSSSWLAREFQVDPRTIAAALRPYGVKPAPIEPGVRGYLTVDLAGLNLPCEPGPAQAAAAAAPGGGGVPADMSPAGAPSEVGPGPAQDHERPPASALPHEDGRPSKACLECDGEGFILVEANEGCGDPECCSQYKRCPCVVSAVDRLSAGAGHDMAPALRAAGLL